MPELKPTVKPATTEAKPEQQAIKAPKEYISARGIVKVIIDSDDQVTVVLDGNFAEDIGSYRRMKSIVIQYKHGQQQNVSPVVQ